MFRHAKLSKSFRESFDLAGKLLDTAERLLGDLDPKSPNGSSRPAVVDLADMAKAVS